MEAFMETNSDDNQRLALLIEFLRKPVHAPDPNDHDVVSAYNLAVIDALKAVGALAREACVATIQT